MRLLDRALVVVAVAALTGACGAPDRPVTGAQAPAGTPGAPAAPSPAAATPAPTATGAPTPAPTATAAATAGPVATAQAPTAAPAELQPTPAPTAVTPPDPLATAPAAVTPPDPAARLATAPAPRPQAGEAFRIYGPGAGPQASGATGQYRDDVAAAVSADLASRLGVAPEAVAIVSVGDAEISSGAPCGAQKQDPAPADRTPGLEVVAAAGGVQYRYVAAGALGYFCG